jgi:hypothetical protein
MGASEWSRSQGRQSRAHPSPHAVSLRSPLVQGLSIYLPLSYLQCGLQSSPQVACGAAFLVNHPIVTWPAAVPIHLQCTSKMRACMLFESCVPHWTIQALHRATQNQIDMV